MPERLLEIPSLDEIRRIFGHDDDARAATNAPDARPDDTLENDDD
ncbi:MULTISPECIES: hypothetical protein [unclassified Luteimonas]